MTEIHGGGGGKKDNLSKFWGGDDQGLSGEFTPHPHTPQAWYTESLLHTKRNLYMHYYICCVRRKYSMQEIPNMNVQPTHSPLPHSVCLFSSNKVASLFFSPTNTAIGDACAEEEKDLPPAQARRKEPPGLQPDRLPTALQAWTAQPSPTQEKPSTHHLKKKAPESNHDRPQAHPSCRPCTLPRASRRPHHRLPGMDDQVRLLPPALGQQQGPHLQSDGQAEERVAVHAPGGGGRADLLHPPKSRIKGHPLLQ